MKLLLRNAMVLDRSGAVQPHVAILTNGSSIEYVGTRPPAVQRQQTLDLAGLWVIPGAIDPHVHVRDLGQREKEDWSSASAAALAGGYTTVFDMPNSVPPTNDLEALQRKRAAAAGAAVSARFWLGATETNLGDLRAVLQTAPADVAGIKVFLAGSSSNEIVRDPSSLKAVMTLAAQYDIPVAVHQELQACLDAVGAGGIRRGASNHHRLRPRACVVQGAQLAIETALQTGCTLYLVHVSTAEEIELLRRLKPRGRIFAEATPHHLWLDSSATVKFSNHAKVNPPLRDPADCSALQQALLDGIIDCLGSDHAPHTLTEKDQPYREAPSGFPGLETSMGLLLDAAARDGIPYKRVQELTSGNAAHIFGLADRGSITAGKRADLTIIDPTARWTVDPARFHTKAHYSPFAGRTLTGRVVATVCAGVYRQTVAKEG